jgi:hypothetical protein
MIPLDTVPWPKVPGGELVKRTRDTQHVLQFIHAAHTRERTGAPNVGDMHHVLGRYDRGVIKHKLRKPALVHLHFHARGVQHAQPGDFTIDTDNPNEGVTVEQHTEKHGLEKIRTANAAVDVRLVDPFWAWPIRAALTVSAVERVHRQRGDAVSDQPHGSEHRGDLRGG